MTTSALHDPDELRRANWLGDRVRGVLCVAWTFGSLLIMGLVLVVPTYLSPKIAQWSMVAWCRVVMAGIRWFAGIRVEIRGKVPEGSCIVASKHQSFLDIVILSATLPKPTFVMKKSIRWVPILNIYAERIGCISIDRGAGHAATKTLLQEAAHGKAAGRQIIIFPQGTRVPPGAPARYRGGTARLYEALEQPVMPVALNTGWFWPRRGVRRSEGTAVASFLQTIPPGLPADDMMSRLEEMIEGKSQELGDEAIKHWTDLDDKTG